MKIGVGFALSWRNYQKGGARLRANNNKTANSKARLAKRLLLIFSSKINLKVCPAVISPAFIATFAVFNLKLLSAPRAEREVHLRAIFPSF